MRRGKQPGVGFSWSDDEGWDYMWLRTMAHEYKIEWSMPANYDPSAVLRKLPSPISREMTEIYNYSVEEDGFYFIDNLVDQRIAGYAMKLFIDEVLTYSEEVTIREL